MSSTDTADEPTAEPGTAPQKKNGKASPLIAIIAVTLVVLCGLVWFLWWFMHRNEVATDDAYVQADIVQIAPARDRYGGQGIRARQSST